MFSLSFLLLLLLGYALILFGVVAFVERKTKQPGGTKLAANPWVYSLSLSVYCTTWTFYGSYGSAAVNGHLFLATYVGSTLCAIFWWVLLRKLVRLKDVYGITSIADLIAARYGKSESIAAISTIMILIGLCPYVALQFKALISSVLVVSGHSLADVYSRLGWELGLGFVGAMTIFTILFGIRKISPTERHPGMVAALAIEGVIKLAASIAVGLFIVVKLSGSEWDQPTPALAFAGREDAGSMMSWLSRMTVSFFAILFLPRQFHVAVVENSAEKHIRTAMWVLPLYLLLINIFVFPAAMAGLRAGLGSSSDMFLVQAPMQLGQPWLSVLILVGGLSAGLGMIMVETMTVATMASNHLIFPLLNRLQPQHLLRRKILPFRWLAAFAFLALAFAYDRTLGMHSGLVTIGLTSSIAILQFIPAVLGGLYWRRGTRQGALAGMITGFSIWLYTAVLPSAVDIGWLSRSLLIDGPFGLAFLRPQGLFGVQGLDTLSNSLVWSLGVNAFLYGLISLMTTEATMEDAKATNAFVDILRQPSRSLSTVGHASASGNNDPTALATVRLSDKERLIRSLFCRYFHPIKAAVLTEECVGRLRSAHGKITPLQLADLRSDVEKTLASALGSASAHSAVRESGLVLPREAHELAASYADMLAELNVSPAELRTRLDYFRERERIADQQARLFRSLAEASQRLSASLDYDTTLLTVSRLPVPRFSQASLLYLREEADGTRDGATIHRLQFAHAELSLETAVNERLRIARPAPSDLPPIDEALRGSRTAITPLEHQAPWLKCLDPYLPRGALTIPLSARGHVLGALTLFFPEAKPAFEAQDIALIEELTHRSAIAIDNARLYRNAHQAIRSRDIFLSVASHELRTPLTPLRSQVQLLTQLFRGRCMRELSEEKVGKLLDSADRQVDRLTRLVTQLLDLSRLRTGTMELHPEQMDLGDMVADVIERFQSELTAARCTVRLNAEPGIRGQWDKIRLEEVFVNLLSNAMKYAPTCAIEVTVSAFGNQGARLSVRDHGPGIAEKDQVRIFHRFERGATVEKVSGFGLGLYISQQIVLAHGGTIRVQSRPGDGASFVVEIPTQIPAKLARRRRTA